MKFSVSAYSFNRLLKNGRNYFEICDMAKELGYEGIEFIDLKTEQGCGETTVIELAGHIRAHCEKIGLPVIAYTIGADFLNGCNGVTEDEVRRVKACVDVAAVLGAKVMRHDSFWKLDGIRSWREAADRIAPAIYEVAQYAAEKGIVTCSENHGMIMQDSDRMEYLMNRVNHANYGWLVDVGNFLCADEDPQHAVGVAAPYAVHVHMKDFIYKKGTEDKPAGSWLTTRGGNYLRGTVVGHGVVPVRPCLNILKRAGYDGYVSVEFEGAEDVLQALEQALEFLRRVDA